MPKGAPDQAGKEISDLAVVPLADLFQRLHSTETGLKAADAAAVLETAGPNQIATAKHTSLLTDFLGRFSNPLVLILLFAAAVSAFTGVNRHGILFNAETPSAALCYLTCLICRNKPPQ